MEEIKKKGRPIREDSRRKVHTVRFDDEEEAMLSHLEIESDDNKSNILRKALRMYYKIQARTW